MASSIAYAASVRAKGLMVIADNPANVDALVAANPSRLVWGSDWPHTELRATTPHDADLVDLLVATLPDAATLRRVCVDNPASLYGF